MVSNVLLGHFLPHSIKSFESAQMGTTSATPDVVLGQRVGHYTPQRGAFPLFTKKERKEEGNSSGLMSSLVRSLSIPKAAEGILSRF